MHVVTDGPHVADGPAGKAVQVTSTVIVYVVPLGFVNIPDECTPAANPPGSKFNVVMDRTPGAGGPPGQVTHISTL